MNESGFLKLLSTKTAKRIIVIVAICLVGLCLCLLPVLLNLFKQYQSYTNAYYEQMLYVGYDISASNDTIVFVGRGDGMNDLYSYDLKHKKVHRLITLPTYEAYPKYMPDGKSLLFCSAPSEYGGFGIQQYTFSTKKIETLTSSTKFSDVLPSPIPNSNCILFARATRFRPKSFGGFKWDNYDIYQMDSDGKNVRRLTHRNYYSISSLSVSYDGKYAYYTPVEAGIEEQRNWAVALEIQNPSNIQRLYNLGNGGDIATHPRKEMIAVISDTAMISRYDISIANKHGGALKPLNITKKSTYNSTLRFATSDQLYFLAHKDDNPHRLPYPHLWRYNLSTGAIQEVLAYDVISQPMSHNKARKPPN